jgi:muramidase (phage lysozyme)
MTDSKSNETDSLGQLFLSLCFALIAGIAFLELYEGRSPFDPTWDAPTPAPLVMQGGDPYLRALMRTISASESNDERPYSIMYGGEHFRDLSRHPDICVTIVNGPNVGDCTTAAGRYQFLTDTWDRKAAKYHPQSTGLPFWNTYSFAPEYQDEVMYRWLSDSEEWGADLSQLLQEGQIEEVLQILSPTWTSLGYGIETNSMSAALPQIYQQMLQEELSKSSSSGFGGDASDADPGQN